MKKLLNFRYAYFPTLGIILGVISSLLNFRQQYITIVIINILFLTLFCLLFYKNVKLLFINLLVFVIFFTMGFMLMHFWSMYYLGLDNPDGVYKVYGKVASINFQNGYNIVRLKNVSLENGYKIDNLKILLNVEDYIELEVGDYVNCFANMTYMYRDFTFKDMYYMSEGISFSGNVIGNVEVITGKYNVFEFVNLSIKNSIFNNMPKEYAGVAYALIVGNCSFIPQESTNYIKFQGYFIYFQFQECIYLLLQ